MAYEGAVGPTARFIAGKNGASEQEPSEFEEGISEMNTAVGGHSFQHAEIHTEKNARILLIRDFGLFHLL